MPYYNLQVAVGKVLSDAAADREDALRKFGNELGEALTFEGSGAAPYLLDEWEQGPHWVNPHIPVFVVENGGN